MRCIINCNYLQFIFVFIFLYSLPSDFLVFPGVLLLLVIFSSVLNDLPVSVLLTEPTTLYDALDNNHVFSYPVSGQLEIDVHVIGNPEPKRVTLWVRRSEAINQVPVSSRAFQWTYERTVGSKAGVIQLSVTGGLESGGISTYILRVENGVVGEHKFEYKFTVNDLQGEFIMLEHV